MVKGLAMKTYDFSKLNAIEGISTDEQSSSDSAERIDSLMQEATSMFNEELFNGFFNANVTMMRDGSKSLRLQKFRTAGIDAILFHYGDADKRFCATFCKNRGECGFHTMRVDDFKRHSIPYPFDSEHPSAQDLSFMSSVVDGLAEGIEALMDSAFKK